MEISESDSASPIYSPQGVPHVAFPGSEVSSAQQGYVGKTCGSTDILHNSCGVVNPLFELEIIRTPLKRCLRSSQSEDDDCSPRLPGRPVQLSLQTHSPLNRRSRDERLGRSSEESLNGNSCYTCKSTEQASDVSRLS